MVRDGYRSLGEVETQFMDVTEAERLMGPIWTPLVNPCCSYLDLSHLWLSPTSRITDASRLCSIVHVHNSSHARMQRIAAFVFNVAGTVSLLSANIACLLHGSTGPWINSSSARVLDSCTDSSVVEPRRTWWHQSLLYRVLGFLNT